MLKLVYATLVFAFGYMSEKIDFNNFVMIKLYNNNNHICSINTNIFFDGNNTLELFKNLKDEIKDYINNYKNNLIESRTTIYNSMAPIECI